jgi:trimeric autotransporter adhesin
MKRNYTIKFLLIVAFIWLTCLPGLKAQNVAITDDAAYTAHPSAMLDVKSTNKGLLIPRLTTVQRNAISSPAAGLLVFDTTLGGIYYYAAGTWNRFAQVGELFSISSNNVSLSNPLWNLGIGTSTPAGKLEVKGNATAADDDPIFEVRNKDGEIVFGVYHEGVRIFVADDGAKGSKGGFAVGSFSRETKGVSNELFRVTPDSVRIYLEDDPAKSSKGGFAVGSFSRETKAISDYEFFRVTPDSVRVYIPDEPVKGSKGGFAVGSFSRESKGESVDYMSLTPKNYLIGHSAGKNLTTGEYNSFLGYEAGKYTTTGNYNAFLGYRSGYNNTIGHSNLFLGYWSGYSNTTGSLNTFVGYRAGALNTTGGENTYLGSYTGSNNTTGSLNSFVGYYTGFQNTTGIGNSFFGNYAGYANTEGYSNVFLGNKAGYNNVAGYSNVYIGDNTGYNNTYGNVNVYIGNYAGYNANNDWANVFIGYYAGYSTTNSNNNVFIGNSAGRNTTWGGQNVYIGPGAGLTNVTGSNNLAIGVGAGQNSLSSDNVFLGYGAGYDNTSGASNVFIGNQAGFSNTTGANNVFLGIQAGYGNSTGAGNVFLGRRSGWGETGSNKLIIENNYIGSAQSSNAMIYGEFDNDNLRFNATLGINRAWSSLYGLMVDGGTSTTYSMIVYKGAYAYGNGFVSASDENLKKDIQPISNSLEKIQSLSGVNFFWDSERYPDLKLDGNKQIGLIAQDVEKVLPELVTQDLEGHKGVAYDKLTAVLVEAIKEQQQQISAQQERIQHLEGQLTSNQLLESEIKNLSEKYEKLLQLFEQLTIK